MLFIKQYTPKKGPSLLLAATTPKKKRRRPNKKRNVYNCETISLTSTTTDTSPEDLLSSEDPLVEGNDLKQINQALFQEQSECGSYSKNSNSESSNDYFILSKSNLLMFY